jgi:cell division protein FtsW
MKAQAPVRWRAYRKFSYDFKLFFPVLVLVGIGIVMVYSASSAIAIKKYGNDLYFLIKQSAFAFLGLITMLIFRKIPYEFYRKYAYLFFVVAIGLLVAVKFTGLGIKVNGAKRWMLIGGVRFQPSEFARIALVIFLSYSLTKKQDHIRSFFIGFVPHVFFLGIFAGLIALQPDFGSVVILAAITWVMMFVAGVRVTYLVASVGALLPFAYAYMMSAAYRTERWLAFLHPWEHASDQAYQIVHSLMAFGTGGIWGTGVGKGLQKLFYLPEPHTDFIFSVIGEELGLVGVLCVLFLYILILWSGLSIAKNTYDLFGSYLAMGITAAIGLQVCINLGVSLGLVPTKGLPLPFLSYGGTSLLVSMISIGILMNIGSGKT